MASITTWARLEPSTRDPSLPGLNARVADPLWLLARQWQTGELDGADNGSPIAVHVTHESAPFTRWASGTQGATGVAYPGVTPLEAVVDPVPAVVSNSDRARGGQKFMALLGDEVGGQLRAALMVPFALTAPGAGDLLASDAAGKRWQQVLSGRTLDGQKLRLALGGDGALPDGFTAALGNISQAQLDALGVAAGVYRSWWDTRFAQTAGAWQRQRQAAPFRLGAAFSDGPITLVAPEHRGGAIDWSSFDIAPANIGQKMQMQLARSIRTKVLPTRISYPGMPALRWWQFEDAQVDMGQISAGPGDIGRLLMAEFALIYGNDFFVAPVSARVGAISRIIEVRVDNNFGETIPVPSTITADGSDASWRMYHCSQGSSAAALEAGMLVIPHLALGALSGPAVEDVLFTRDEMANVAWAIERRVRGAAGPSVDPSQIEQSAEPQPIAPSGASLHYRMTSSMPASWQALATSTAGTLTLAGNVAPLGQLLGAGPRFSLDAVELPRNGRQLTCHAKRARAADGSVLSWYSWVARPGRGESASDLRFDSLVAE